MNPRNFDGELSARATGAAGVFAQLTINPCAPASSKLVGPLNGTCVSCAGRNVGEGVVPVGRAIRLVNCLKRVGASETSSVQSASKVEMKHDSCKRCPAMLTVRQALAVTNC